MATATVAPLARAQRLSVAHRFSVLAGLVLPSLGVPALTWQLTHSALTLVQIILMQVCSALLYLFSGFGITAGYHRLFTHNSYAVSPWLRKVFAVAGSAALQGPLISWVASHRKHHQYSDKAGDPHSPHLHGKGWRGWLSGFFHSHMGWLFWSSEAPSEKYARELTEEPFMRAISGKKWYLMIALLSLFGVPALLGFTITGDASGALQGIVWIGLVRAFLLLQFTFAINSVCHTFGKKTFAIDDESRDVWWLRLFTLGESNHNGHHAFPGSFRHGLAGGLDPSAMLILLMEKVGWARNLKRIAPERVEAKLRVAT